MQDKLSQRVYEWVCQQLLSGALRGGDRVSELAVAKATGVSRSPVREALVRLRAEGLIEHVPKLGASVRIPSRAEMVELYQAREWLEGGAAATLARRHEAEVLKRLQAYVDGTLEVAREFYRRGVPEMPEDLGKRLAALDTEFHLAVMQASGNRLGLEALARTHLMIQIGGYRLKRYNAEVVTRIYTDHDTVLRAIRRGDEAEAWGAMVRHVRWSEETVRNQLAAGSGGKGAGVEGPAGLPAVAVSGVGAAWPEPMRALIGQLEGAAGRR
jgi:DNA-binding GntR family transcriptional regulator